MSKTFNRKRKGIAAERELLHLFWSKGWTAVRVAGSGSIKYPMPDLLVSNGFKVFAIEIKKIDDTYKYFSKKKINELNMFSKKFGAIPIVAIKFQRKPWIFLFLDDLEETNLGYTAKVKNGNIKGLTIDELISYFDTLV